VVEKWHCDTFFSVFFGFPYQYNFTVFLYIHVSPGG
jgi:hypothetical protein